MAKLFANSGDPDQTQRSAASDLGLHRLLITLLRVSQLQWVNGEVRKINLLFEKVHHIRSYDDAMSRVERKTIVTQTYF